MADKKKLDDMLNALIDKKDEQAQVHFHNYLEDKMRDVLTPVTDEVVVDDKSTKKED